MTDRPGRAVGILGGTFDPVHYGHLRAAVEVREKLALDEVRMLPSARPPHRAEPSAAAGHRLEMLRLAIACQDFLVADDCEIQREGPSYMVDTLQQVRERLGGGAPVVLIVGQDAANGLDRWHRWRQLFELAHIAVMRRPEAASDYHGELLQQMRRRRVADAADLHQSPCGRVFPLEITQLEISSTAIRGMIAAGQSPKFLAPPPVIGYIREHRLYVGSE